MENKINIQNYFNKGIFVIPEYQRGYKWSVKENEKESSLEFFMKSLITAFENNLNEYFIEAVTVVEKEGGKEIVLVDGQQRTTSLFLLFIVLNDFEFIQNKLRYDVREDSHKWLNNQISSQKEQIVDEDTQDIFYFKEAVKQINNHIEGVEKSEKEDKKNTFTKDGFLQFIKENVYLLYNVIPEDKAINTFIALNGLKAIMKDEELIKSELLIKSSRMEKVINKSINSLETYLKNLNEFIGFEWKINEDRGRLARNWDKWLYWWNQEDVKNYFGTGNRHPLYYLLVTYWNINSDKEKGRDFSFDNFKSQFITNSKHAKQHFEGLRKLQKTFEDLYNDWERYNLLGLSFNTSINKNDTLLFFINNREDKDSLSRFTKWTLVECKLKEIKDENNKAFIEKRESLRNKLIDKDLYENEGNEGKDQAYIQLLRMNVLAMNNRKFDFGVFKLKSLEHICPQNPPEENEDFIKSKIEIDENSDGINSIGNLVLLDGSTNSSLSNKPYDKKKQRLFDRIKKGFLLPHTLKVFSKSFESTLNEEEVGNLFNNEKYWQADDVNKNKNYFFTEFDNYYGK